MICTVDLGTTTIKAGIFDIEGNQISLAKTERSTIFPTQGRAEQIPSDGWEIMCNTVRESVAKSGLNSNEITAMVLSTQRGTFLGVDRNCVPLTNAITWMDTRGIPICDRIKMDLGVEYYYNQTGLPAAPYYGISKLLWIKENNHDLYEKTYKFVPEHTFIHHKLGADELLCDTASASFLAALNVKTKQWNAEILSKLQFSIEKLPTLTSSTQIVGTLSGPSAEKCGLAKGVKLVLGGGDKQCAGIGSGTVEIGKVMLAIGTGTSIQTYLPTVRLDPNHNLNCAAHVVPYAWEMEGHTQASTVVYRWVRDQFSQAEVSVASQTGIDPYEYLNVEASRVTPGAEGLLFLPSFNGLSAPIDYSRASGAFLGLNLNHTRAHLVRAVMEGIVMEFRWVLDAMEKSGAQISELRAVEGVTISPIWNQLVANILQRPVCIPKIKDATLSGAAQCAAVALGYFKDFQESARSWVKPNQIYEPDHVLSQTYQDLFEVFVSSYDSLRRNDIFGRLRKLES